MKVAVGALVAAMVLVTTASSFAMASRNRSSNSVTIVRDVSLELIGQGINTPLGVVPGTSTQFGYVAYLRGLPVFAGEPQNEKNALFTFYLQAATLRVINDGPLRMITRVARVTIYRDPSSNGDFSDPDTFRDGTRVLVAGLRQQVVVDTITGAFSAHNLNTITQSSPFAVGKGSLQLGVVGQKFQTYLTGHLNMPGPPSAYFAGYTSS